MQIRTTTPVPILARKFTQQKGTLPMQGAAAASQVRFGNDMAPLDLPFPINEWMNVAVAIASERPDNNVNGLDLIVAALMITSTKLEQIDNKLNNDPAWKRDAYEGLAKGFSVDLGIPMEALRNSSNFNPMSSPSFMYDETGRQFNAVLKNFTAMHASNMDIIKQGLANNNHQAVHNLMTDLTHDFLRLIYNSKISVAQGPQEITLRVARGYYAMQFQKLLQNGSSATQETPSSAGVKNRSDRSRDFHEFHKYGNDMVLQAQNGRFSRVLLRREAIDRVIAIIRSDGDRTNILLNAASGEGKTFLINGLAQRIAEGDVPDDLKNASLFTLDLGSLNAGTMYHGTLEDRLKKILGEIETFLKTYPSEKLLVFIDEIQNLDNVRSGEILNLLKASGLLERQNLTWIGATTPNDWQKSSLRMDNAFAGRFKELHLPSFNDDEKLAILAANAEKVEDAKGLVIPMEMLEKALREAKSAYPHNALRRSVDVLNLAASLATGQPLDVSNMKDKLQRKEMWLRALERQKTQGTLNSRYAREYDELPQQVAEMKSEIAALEGAPKGMPILTDKHISQAMSVLTGETLSVLSQDEVDKLFKAKGIIGRYIVGQPEALESINQALMEIVVRMKSGNKDNRPITSMILLGPTGVGKTESVKVIAKEFMNNKLIRLDMSDFMEKFAASRITGAPPGYVGYEDGSALTDRVRENPQSVILFDEIEKAHPDVFNLLLQILEEGELIDNHGQKVSFRNTVIAMTSNLNQQEISELIAKHRERATGKDPDMEAEALDREMRDLITQKGDRKGFRPELLGRTDYVIPFNQLTKSNVSDILDIQLRKMNEDDQYLRDNNLTVTLSKRGRARLIELIGAAPLDDESTQKRPMGFVPSSSDKGSQSGKDTGLQAGARDARKQFSRKVIREVYKELILKQPNLADATLVVDFNPNAGKWELIVEPKRKPQLPPTTPPSDDTPPRPPRTLAFA